MTTTTARGERAEAHGRSGRRRKIEIPLFNLINLIFIAFAWKWRVLFGLVGVHSWFVVSGRSCQICASILVSPSSLLLRLFSSCPVSLCFIDFESNFNSIFCFFLLLLLLFSLVLFFWLAAFFSGRIRHQRIFQCRSCAWESKECERRGGSRVCVYTLCMLCVWCSLENTFCRCFIEWKLPITISRESYGSNCLLSGQATSPQFSLDCCKIFT